MKKTTIGITEGVVSIVLNTLLFAVKYSVGLRARSVAMTADAWHTLSDSFTSVVVLAGFWIASRPADRRHPFGHGRAETVGAVVIGTLLLVAGAAFLRESVLRLARSEAAAFGGAAVAVFLASAILKEALARFSIRAGLATDAPSLVADGWHHRSDAIASALIVAGALASRPFWWIDGVLGIGVSLLLFHTAVGIVRSAASRSMGEAHDDALERRVREVVREAAPAAGDVHHLHVHRYGDHVEMTLHVRVPAGMNVAEAHETAAAIERAVGGRLGATATVHVEPAGER
ncbi:MAG: cation diffusion facilitator family transporter [bacterium]|nr:cation diffusion facilitator family transporter [bacterium]